MSARARLQPWFRTPRERYLGEVRSVAWGINGGTVPMLTLIPRLTIEADLRIGGVAIVQAITEMLYP